MPYCQLFFKFGEDALLVDDKKTIDVIILLIHKKIKNKNI